MLSLIKSYINYFLVKEKKEPRHTNSTVVIRKFLSEEDSRITSSIYCYYSDENEEAFVEIASCKNKIRIHLNSKEQMNEYITRLKKLHDILSEYILKIT